MKMLMEFRSAIAQVFSGMTPAAQETTKSTPAVVGATYGWVTANGIVLFLTGVYVAIQIGYIVRKWWREEKDWKRSKRGRS